MSKDFCKAAIEDLLHRINVYANESGSLYHMLVLPEGETLKVPVIGGHPIGSGNHQPPGPFEFGKSKVVSKLPPEGCWPSGLQPLQAVSVDQEFSPYRPLAREPYRVHLFFGRDETALTTLQSFCAEIVDLSEELRRAVYGNANGTGFGQLIYSAGDCIHDENTEILDRWLCTIHWWAWKVTDSPIHVQPQIVFGQKGIPTTFSDRAVQQKFAFSWIEQDVFHCSVETLRFFLRFMELPPCVTYASTYPADAEVEYKSEAKDLATWINLNGRRWRCFVDRELGTAGANGTVFEGQSESGDKVAIKRLKLSLASSPEARELEIVEGLVGKIYDHVIPVFDCGRETRTNDCYVVMALADRSLAEECQSRAMAPLAAIHAVIDIAKGLAEVGNIVHRDIKPENILSHDGKWKLTDFGISRFVDSATASETRKRMLSPKYASPEQWKEERATHASDIYSLGCLAYFLLVGSPPFVGPTRDDYRQQHVESTPRPITNVDERLSTLVSMMLQKPPEARPKLDRVLEVLQACLEPLESGAGSSFQKLAAAATDLERSKARKSSQAIVLQSERERRTGLGRNAYHQLEEIARELFDQIAAAVPNIEHVVRRSGVLSFESALGTGRLIIELETTHVHPDGEFRQSGWDVVASGTIGVVQSNPEYRWWSSLWYTNLGQRNPSYRWFEVAYYTSPLIRQRRKFEPFHLIDDVKQADLAASNVMGTINIAFGPAPIDDDAKRDFFERWAERLALAATGSLRPPSSLPIN